MSGDIIPFDPKTNRLLDMFVVRSRRVPSHDRLDFPGQSNRISLSRRIESVVSREQVSPEEALSQIVRREFPDGFPLNPHSPEITPAPTRVEPESVM